MSNPQFVGTTLGNFRPTNIAGLTVWIDASQTASFTLTGGTSNVASITDLAENVSYTVGGTPTWSSTAFTSANGLTYPAFNMTSGRLIRALTNSCTTFQHTAFVVGRRNVLTGDGWSAVAMATTTGGSSQFFRVLDNRDPSVIGNFRAVAFGGLNVSQTSNANTTQPFLYVNTFNGAATLNSYMYHSQQFFPFNPSGANPGFTAGSNGNAVMIGTDGSTGAQTANQWPGTLCEVILYRNTVLSPANREIVEGYLSWKWGLQANLPNAHPYASLSLLSTAPPTGFNPEMISGLNLWLDASDPSTLEGTPIIRWRNKSRVGGAVDGIGGIRTTFGGYPVVGFDGTSTRFLSDTQTVPTNSHTFVLVYRPNSTGAGNTSVIRYQRASGGYIVFPYWQGGTTQRGYITSFDGIPIDAGNSTLVGNAVTNALNIIFISITSGSQQVLLNGTLQSANTQALSAGTSPLLTIGYFQPGVSEFFSGDIAEILIYSRVLTLDERINVTGYEAWKWGLQSTLPVNAYAPWGINDIRNYTFFPTLPYGLYYPTLDVSPVFNPLSISGSVVWLDAQDSTSFTYSTFPTITEWRNKAPGATPAFAAGTPSSLLNSLNGRQTVVLGSGNYFAGGATVSGTTISCFAVAFTSAALPKVGSDQRLISLVTSTSLDFNTASAVIGMFNQNSTSVIGTYRNGVFVSATPLSQLVPFIGASIYNGTNGQMFKDGSPGNVTPSAGTFGIVKYSVGFQLNSPGNTEFWIGNIGEVLVYNRNVSDSERQTIEGYLAWKWGMVANLPAGHPFKNYPPPP